MTNKLTDSEILHAWHVNADPWIKAIDNNEIESRKLVTNKAIIDTILNLKPRNILDIGCGEGWLAAKLLEQGLDVFGIDAIPALIEKAQKINGGTFAVCTYEDLASYKFNKKFDCLVCNFSLIGKESTENVIATASQLLEANGRFVIQTLHPVIACGDAPYREGWREGSWAGFSKDFTTPAPWYFRTLENWVELFGKHRLKIKNMHEPLHPATNKPASILFDLASEK